MAEASTEKLYRRVIDAVMAEIQSGRFPVGSRLPAERELAETYQVSRTTIREAMVALEMLGVVEMRKGSGIYATGSVAAEATEAALDIGAFELIEARRVFEGEVAALAARYATPEQISRLEALLVGMRDPDVCKAELADREFHIAVAQATGNSAMVSVVADLWDMRERAPLARNILQRARGPDLGDRVEEHRGILEALKAKDPSAARAAMRAHLDQVIDHLLTTTENEDIAAAKSRTRSLRERAAVV